MKKENETNTAQETEKNAVEVTKDNKEKQTGKKNGKKADRETDSPDRRRLKRLTLVTVLLAIAVVVLIVLLVIVERKNRIYGETVEASTLDQSMDFDAPDDLKGMITENYVAYLKQAYILFGEYPDCTYFKVVEGVERDDLDFENDFYTKEGTSYMNYYPNGEKAGRVAIDVSEYQENIDWAAVKTSGVEIAIVRAGFRGYGEEGNIKKDLYFDQNMQGAIAAGLEVGTYFFTEAVNYEEGVEEANLVLSMVKPYQLKQPIIIDTEKIDAEGVRANDISVEERSEAIRGFCETIEAAGYTPMIYASTYWFCSALDLSKLGKYEFWLAAYDTPQFPYHVEGWQYASDGSVPGISGNVDLNVWMR